jgi:hypothetical protein
VDVAAPAAARSLSVAASTTPRTIGAGNRLRAAVKDTAAQFAPLANVGECKQEANPDRGGERLYLRRTRIATRLLLRAARTACDDLCAFLRGLTREKQGAERAYGAFVSYDSASSTSRIPSARVTWSATLGRLSDGAALKPLPSNEGVLLSPPNLLTLLPLTCNRSSSESRD